MKLDVFQHIVGTKNGIEVTEYTPVAHAHWIWRTGFYEWACSGCGCIVEDDEPCADEGPVWNYCPNCGAKMDEVSE